MPPPPPPPRRLRGGVGGGGGRRRPPVQKWLPPPPPPSVSRRQCTGIGGYTELYPPPPKSNARVRAAVGVASAAFGTRSYPPPPPRVHKAMVSCRAPALICKGAVPPPPPPRAHGADRHFDKKAQKLGAEETFPFLGVFKVPQVSAAAVRCMTAPMPPWGRGGDYKGGGVPPPCQSNTEVSFPSHFGDFSVALAFGGGGGGGGGAALLVPVAMPSPRPLPKGGLCRQLMWGRGSRHNRRPAGKKIQTTREM